MKDDAATCHTEITRLLTLAALVPPSTAEVERTFSLMKLICMRLQNRLKQSNLANCMRICKFPVVLDDSDYANILKLWLEADETKSKKRKVASRLL